MSAHGTVMSAHEHHVAARSGMIAEQLRVDRAHAVSIRLAGLLHDVGKVGIPDELLSKPGRLTDDEYMVIKAHSIIGERIVLAMDLVQESKWVRHHHERVDGGGYPDGLIGAQIPWESRIIFVADCFDAIISPRAYRPARSAAEAIAEIRRGAGTQFDPECVEALAATLGA